MKRSSTPLLLEQLDFKGLVGDWKVVETVGAKREWIVETHELLSVEINESLRIS